jgi:hypothetical protein
VGLHFVAFGGDYSERARPEREGSDCGELLRKNRAEEPRKAVRGPESQRAPLVARSELDREAVGGPSRLRRAQWGRNFETKRHR